MHFNNIKLHKAENVIKIARKINIVCYINLLLCLSNCEHGVIDLLQVCTKSFNTLQSVDDKGLKLILMVVIIVDVSNEIYTCDKLTYNAENNVFTVIFARPSKEFMFWISVA